MPLNRPCTWKDCAAAAVNEQRDRNGAVWADLCAEHHKELDDALTKFDPKTLMRCWVRAGGGAEKMAKRTGGS